MCKTCYEVPVSTHSLFSEFSSHHKPYCLSEFLNAKPRAGSTEPFEETIN